MPIREQHIDMAAGIMIMWMILGHVASHANYNGAFFKMGTYLSFFMPWFFYKAGMFYQNKHDSIRDRANRGAKVAQTVRNIFTHWTNVLLYLPHFRAQRFISFFRLSTATLSVCDRVLTRKWCIVVSNRTIYD